MRRTKLELTVLYILSVIIAAYAFLPFLWVFLTALKSPEQIYSNSSDSPPISTTDTPAIR